MSNILTQEQLSSRFPEFVTGMPFRDRIRMEKRTVKILAGGRYEWNQQSWEEPRAILAGECDHCRSQYPDLPFLIRLRGNEYRMCSQICFEQRFDRAKKSIG